MDWSPIAGAGGALALLNAAWQGLALVGFVWLVLRFTALRRNASTVCAVWLVTFGLVTALPAIDLSLQRTVTVAAPATESLGKRGLVLLAVRQPAIFVQQVGGDALRTATRLTPSATVPALLIGWAVVAGFFLLRLGRGYRHLFRLKRDAIPAPHLRALVPLADRRDTRVAVSAQLTTACAAGFLRPMILLPQSDIDSLERADLARVIAHEHGHLARFDDWTNAAIQLVNAVFFFLPGLAIAARQIEIARERACDDVAIERTGDRTAYARMLADVVERAVYARRMATAPGFGASDVFSRVNHALDDNRDRRGGINPGGLLFAAAVVVVALGMARIGLPRITHVRAAATPTVIFVRDTSDSSLLDALTASGYGHVDPDDLAELANHGVTAASIFALPAEHRVDALIRMHDHGVTADFARAVVRAFPSVDADELIELADHGVSSESAAAFAALDSSLCVDDIVELTDHGVTPDFVRRLAAHGYTRIGVDKLITLHDSGFDP